MQFNTSKSCMHNDASCGLETRSIRKGGAYTPKKIKESKTKFEEERKGNLVGSNRVKELIRKFQMQLKAMNSIKLKVAHQYPRI